VKAGANGKLTFMGWRRENGRVGVRNHVLILPLDDLSNAVCEAVANARNAATLPAIVPTQTVEKGCVRSMRCPTAYSSAPASRQ